MDGVATTALLGASVCLRTVVAVCQFSNRVRDLGSGGRFCVRMRSAAKREVCAGSVGLALVSVFPL